MEDLRSQLARFIGTQVALGVATCSDIVESSVEWLYRDAAEDDVRAVAWPVVQTAFAAHLKEQQSWPAVTDSDRLTLAFRDLDAAGIVARESFTCCNTCGHNDIGNEIPPGEKRLGYVFYHEQDAERCAGGGELWLSWGGHETTAGEAVRVLRAHGLHPVWGGSRSEGIRIPMIWRRRRLGRLAAHPGLIEANDFTVNLDILGVWDWRLTPGAVSARRLAALYLPWLPGGTCARLSTQDGSILVVSRSWDRLIGELSTPGQEATTHEVNWRQAWPLVTLLRGEPLPLNTPEDRAEALIEVTCHYSSGSHHGPVLMDLAESVSVLREMTASTGNWATYTSRSGTAVQHRWEPGPRLWMQTPDEAAKASRGRYVTISQAEHIITTLVTEGTVALA